MFGAFMDAAMQIPKNMHAEEMQDDAQTFAHFETQAARQSNAHEAALARDWTERMSSTQHQRGVRDMVAAGLNPILAVRQGGASVGSAAQASSAAANAGMASPGAPSSHFQNAVNSGLVADRLAAEIPNIREDTVKKTQEGYALSARTELDKQQTNLTMEQEKTQRALTQRALHEASIAGNTAKGSELEGEIDETTYGKIMRYINRSVRSITGGSSALHHLQQSR